MSTPTVFGGATCTKVQRRGHLASLAVDDKGTLSVTERYVVLFDGPAPVVAAYSASDGTNTLPGRTSQHPDLGYLFGKTVGIKLIEEETRQYFDATIVFTDEINLTDSPLNLPPDITWDFQDGGNAPYARDCDPDGPKAVTTSARERYGDFLQRATSTVVVTWRKNVLPEDINAARALQYAAYQLDQNSPPVPVMNSDAFSLDGLAVAPHQARFKGAQISGVQKSNGVTYRTISITLALRETWVDVVEDRGFYSLNGSGVPQQIVMSTNPADAQATQYGWPLDGAGHKKTNATDAPAHRTFYAYPSLAFTPFGFA